LHLQNQAHVFNQRRRNTFCLCQSKASRSGQSVSSLGPIISRLANVITCPGMLRFTLNCGDVTTIYLDETQIIPSSKGQWQRLQRATPLRGLSLKLTLHGLICAASTTVCPSAVSIRRPQTAQR